MSVTLTSKELTATINELNGLHDEAAELRKKLAEVEGRVTELQSVARRSVTVEKKEKATILTNAHGLKFYVPNKAQNRFNEKTIHWHDGKKRVGPAIKWCRAGIQDLRLSLAYQSEMTFDKR